MELPGEVFTAEDSLGWVYQFWQSERKDEVNASGDKITGETLPAVTQLFTEHYMVLFLLHNTIGAWWAARLKAEGRIPKTEWAKCQTEEDCRKLVGLPGYEFTYLRFLKNGSGEWVPAAGDFPGWPKSLKQFKLLDPCCGSGHFLVAAFLLLVLMRMHDEKVSANDACDAVLRENLHGLELDQRCTQIAAFALALTAWKFTEDFRPLPPMNIACSGLGVNARKDEWLALANGDTRLSSGLEQLYDLFQKAPELGSLIDPRRLVHGELLTASFAELQPLMTKALHSEKTKGSDDLNEIGVAVQGMARAAGLLAGGFTLVVTNVPYLGQSKQNDVLKGYCDRCHPAAKADLATVFVERCNALCVSGGTAALITPQNWLFLHTYKKLREVLLDTVTANWMVELGAGAFQTPLYDFSFALVCLSRFPPLNAYRYISLTATKTRDTGEKAASLVASNLEVLGIEDCRGNEDKRLLTQPLETGTALSQYAQSFCGLQTGDNFRFVRCFWEFSKRGLGWEFLQRTPSTTVFHDGLEQMILWEDGRGQLTNEPGFRDRLSDERQAMFDKIGIGFVVHRMGQLPVSLLVGRHVDQNGAVIIPSKTEHAPAVWAFLESPDYCRKVRTLDNKVGVTPFTLTKVTFDLSHWQRVAAEKHPSGLPEPYSNDPTQWIFNGHPIDSTLPLQVGVARLLGYVWPRQTGQSVSGAAPVPADALMKLADEDGIVCIPSVRGEAPAPERLRALLATAYGKKWGPAVLDEMLGAVAYGGSSLEDWLRNGFFVQHCKVFQQRPFIWQIWDGRKDGFSALVNYHKLDHRLLEKLTYTYLGDWIKKQQEAVANEESGADDRLLQARQLQEKLKLILEGEGYPNQNRGYDIFVRWKPLEQQPIGWNPDLNDGVRLNIRPFVEADVLRKRPNIKWGVDRGKNAPGSPWGEERDNDKHLSLAEKQKARKK